MTNNKDKNSNNTKNCSNNNFNQNAEKVIKYWQAIRQQNFGPCVDNKKLKK